MTAPAPSVVFLGVRHHSPACARLVARTIDELRPAYVLVEGPADMNDRLDELLLGHELPVAVFSHYRDAERTATSWTPLCDYSPEWVALTHGRACGAEVRFIDLPAWHPAFAERTNRYADAEARYEEATRRLSRKFSVDSVDALWDRLFEVEDDAGLAERLDTYFRLVRGDTRAGGGDRDREAYMAAWVRAAMARAGSRPVLVVTGGFHQPALRALADDEQHRDRTAADGTATGGTATGGGSGKGPAGRETAGKGSTGNGSAGGSEWPDVPVPAEEALAGSFLVPYSFRQLDAFAGYQSGMPSPGYYQQVWEEGPKSAAHTLLRAVAERLRARSYPVSTADLIAARTLTEGLGALRGHPVPARIDVLDGLAGALIKDDLDQPLPWTRRGTIGEGTHPAVVEMVSVCGGDRAGRLHPATPAPPLVHDVAAQLARWKLDSDSTATLDLSSPADLDRSRVLHRLRVLGIPGRVRVLGPEHGADPVFTERWEPRPAPGRDAALVEAGAHGAGLAEAAATVLTDRMRSADGHAQTLAGALFDAVLCGVTELTEPLLELLAGRVRAVREPGPLGEVLGTALGLWRHDRVYGVARSALLASVVDGAVTRILWLLEGSRGPSGVDFARLGAVVAVRDALLHAAPLLSVPRTVAAAVAHRIAQDREAPVDLRGAAFGLHRVLAALPDEDEAESRGDADTGKGAETAAEEGPSPQDGAAAVQAAAGIATLGDWLAGLFAVAREDVTTGASEGRSETSLIDVLDVMVDEMSEPDFLVALPALRQAFGFFPPRERERIAQRLLERRGVRGSARSLLRTGAHPALIARARSLEETVTRLLDHHGLRAAR